MCRVALVLAESVAGAALRSQPQCHSSLVDGSGVHPYEVAVFNHGFSTLSVILLID
jgi:hypothetical protein